MNEEVSITLHGTSDQLDVVVDSLLWARDMHGFAMSQTVGTKSAAHREQWDALRDVLDKAKPAIASLRLGART